MARGNAQLRAHPAKAVDVHGNGARRLIVRAWGGMVIIIVQLEATEEREIGDRRGGAQGRKGEGRQSLHVVPQVSVATLSYRHGSRPVRTNCEP